MDGMSLLDVLRGVMLDPAEQAVYDADPGAYLGQYGYEDVDPADLSEAFGLVADTLPAHLAQAAWTGESGPQSPALGDDTTEFDGGGPDDAAIAIGDDAVDQLDAPDGDDDGDGDGDTVLSFGQGEDDDAGVDALDGADDGYGLFGTAAPDDADAAEALDAGDPGDADGGFGQFAGGEDSLDDGLDDSLDDDLDHELDDDLDDTDDLAEIDGFGPVDHGPDDIDIGSF